MRLLVLTTSFPSTAYPHSGIFVRRLLERLPQDIKITLLTPGLDRPAEFFKCGNRIEVREFRYAPKRRQTLAHREGGIPAALRRQPWQWAMVPLFCLAMLLETLKSARHADLIHAHWSVCGVIAGFAGRLTGKPVVATLRGTDVIAAEKSLLFRWAIYGCAFLCDRLVTVGQAMALHSAKWMRGKLERVAVIPNGVGSIFGSTKKTHCVQGFTACVIGHLIPLKNVDTVVRAFSVFAEHVSSAELLVVGDGEDRAALESAVQRLGLGKRVSFTGAVAPDAVPEILSRCNALVLASRSEGRPNVVLEAMAAGVPVVASDIDGVREMIVHGERGLLFAVGDERQLAAHLCTLKDDPELSRRLAANARQWVDDQGLTWENSATRYANLYHEVLQKRRRWK